MDTLQEWGELFVNRQDLLWITLWEHIQLSLFALVIAVMIAVPVGVILTRYRRLAEPVIGVAAVLQTIPSLALLGFMILLLGIGTGPAVVALTAYALLPIMRNTYTGISELDPAVLEAADAMGMSSYGRLRKVELPMAMPVIMAGVRTSMVLIVGTATLASLIGAGGLGDLIMTGINRADNGYILMGAIPAAILALLFDRLLRLIESKSRGTSLKPVGVAAALAVAVLLLPMVAWNTEYDLVIGGKHEAEPEILANMYAALIEEETDLSVDVEADLGGTDFVFNALRQGDIDVYPEFTGTALTELLDQSFEGLADREAYEQARDLMEEEHGKAFLEPMAFHNTYAVAVREDIDETYDIETISDLTAYDQELTAGFSHEFIDREDGYAGLQETHGLDFDDLNTLDASLRSNALVSEDVDVIDIYSTQAEIEEFNLTLLEDAESFFPPYQGAPLMRGETLERYPELEPVLNTLGGEITEDEMREMNYAVDFEDEDPEDVARTYLHEQGWIEE
ncbi:osmoprotectant transport system permease protein [Salsuginibacillus halophilus]|uniref:Osmoprotectant transport system permease protein n=1 Tax=Salsuginibacillus halophilus TaxID=517424 RepID=A0A2P8H9Q8_9BACI|nr:ABC transporter permease/substrate-binding protein [Salsuginibacillus halophilus]PSL42931.1 osmoprotectant transport system permease protein [Salsuginibacillus halophilus]